MANQRPGTFPALADLTQDIAGPLPVGLLRDWAAGERTSGNAEELLSPFRKRGIVVASDTSGLSRLSQERDLLEVLWLVSQPKQILHAIGTEVGGRAVGIWVADNTEMFYPPPVTAMTVVDAMIEAQARIAERAEVRIGLCLHSGVFYEIGGGLYGGDAQTVEGLAEDHAGPEEILATGELLKEAGTPDGYSFSRRFDLDTLHPEGVFSVRGTRRLAGLVEKSFRYPHPFTADFFAMLRKMKNLAQWAKLKQQVYDAYQTDRFVVFLARERGARSGENLAAVLDGFMDNALMAQVVSDAVGAAEHVAESGGGLAILVFDSGKEALEFAQIIRERFRDNNLAVSIGIDRGPVLLFEKSGGGFEGIVGDPINLSSKLSEDLGRPGKILITGRAGESIGNFAGSERFEAAISRVAVSGFVL